VLRITLRNGRGSDTRVSFLPQEGTPQDELSRESREARWEGEPRGAGLPTSAERLSGLLSDPFPLAGSGWGLAGHGLERIGSSTFEKGGNGGTGGGGVLRARRLREGQLILPSSGHEKKGTWGKKGGGETGGLYSEKVGEKARKGEAMSM